MQDGPGFMALHAGPHASMQRTSSKQGRADPSFTVVQFLAVLNLLYRMFASVLVEMKSHSRPGRSTGINSTSESDFGLQVMCAGSTGSRHHLVRLADEASMCSASNGCPSVAPCQRRHGRSRCPMLAAAAPRDLASAAPSWPPSGVHASKKSREKLTLPETHDPKTE